MAALTSSPPFFSRSAYKAFSLIGIASNNHQFFRELLFVTPTASKTHHRQTPDTCLENFDHNFLFVTKMGQQTSTRRGKLPKITSHKHQGVEENFKSFTIGREKLHEDKNERQIDTGVNSQGPNEVLENMGTIKNMKE